MESSHRHPLECDSVIRISNILWPRLHLTTNYISQCTSCNYHTDYNKVCSCTFSHIVLFFTRPLPGLYSLFLDYIWEPLPTPIQWIFSNSRKFAGAYHNLHSCSRIRSQGSSSMATDWWVWLFRSLGDHLWDANRFCLG